MGESEVEITMALLKNFAPSKKLSDPNGPLSRTVPATAIAATNVAVFKLVTVSSEPTSTPIRPHQHLQLAAQAKIESNCIDNLGLT